MNVRFVAMGDTCVSAVFDDQIDPLINARCVAIAEALDRHPPNGVRDVVPTFNAVAVYFDSARTDRRQLLGELRRVAAEAMPTTDDCIAPIEIPVEYGGEAALDLPSVAAFGGCSERDVVRLHSEVVYRVYMLGFLPGFAYMGSVDARIAMPRLDSPRARVPAGSVGIAGAQTGIYPCDTPGGWRLIGRTATKMFDPARANPFLLQAGARVKFIAA
jgi:KipI family sensor histidine kinase inhibitor